MAVLTVSGSAGPALSTGQWRAPEGDRPVAVVRIPFPQEDGSLTPYTFEVGYSLVTLVYDTLYWRDRDGVAQPWLAQSAEVSPDGRRVTIRLAEGATWHDGRPVTSADVAFTFRFVGDQVHPRFTPQVQAILRVDTPDPRTAVVTLRQPAPGFLDQPLADVPILPAHIWSTLPAEAVAPPGLPVGSGPYRLVEHQDGQSYRFEANPGYFRGAPAVTTVEVPIMNDADALFTALEQRRVDMIPVALTEQLSGRLSGLGTEVVTGSTYLGTVLLLNVRQSPFDRPEVRRAIARAISLDRVVRVIGNAVAADRGYVHPESRWAPSDTLHVHDEAAAEAELAQFGLPPIEILVPDNDPLKQDAGDQVAVALRRAGLTASFREVPRSELTAALGLDGSTPSFTAAIGASPALASYDPDFLTHLFGPRSTSMGLNPTGYSSSEFDALAARIATTPDPEARRAAVVEALKVLARDAPAIPLLYQTGAFAFRPTVYDSWVYVKGAGIFDKRSFVDREQQASPPRSESERPGRPAPEGGGGGDANGFSLGMVGLGLMGLAVLLVVVAALRR